MKVSLSWLKEYVDIDIGVEALGEALTMVGLEVEAVEDRYAYLDDVVVGRIQEIKPHPDAVGLSVCRVDVGGAVRTIICGAKNIGVGRLVVVALPGVVLPSGKQIEAGRIHGLLSEGMLCSESELVLGEDAAGILLLPDSVAPGKSLASALGFSDFVMEVNLTPNRSDCFSIVGIAREVAAIVKKPLRLPKITLPPGKDGIETLTSVTIQAPDHCPRYAARLLWDVSIGPSPFWMQNRLRSVGLRPINNVVDVTNFVMMELGQPLHAFDFDRLAEKRIVVRTAQAGQTFTTLDAVERNLPLDALMICDGKAPVALAGIMGGLDSEIEDTTTRVLIESAYFNPISIRRTAKRLGLSTESSHRFERGVDPEGTIRAVDRAAALMVQLAGGAMASGVIDAHPKPVPRQVIELSVQRTNRLLGTHLGQEDIATYLRSVELAVDGVDGDRLKVTPPAFRVDLKRPEDLMEEVARLNGYDAIPTTHPATRVAARAQSPHLQIREDLRGILTGCGFSEIITYSFIGRDQADKLQLGQTDERRRAVPILNPLTEDQDVMRTSLVPGLLTTMFKNSTQRNENLRIFELGKVFIATDGGPLPDETEMVSGLWTGTRGKRAWHDKEVEADFYDIKGVVETFCAGLNVKQVRFAVPPDADPNEVNPNDAKLDDMRCPYFKPGRVAAVSVGDVTVGYVGEIAPSVLQNYDLKKTAYCFDLNFDRLQGFVSSEKRATPISRFPSTTRDMALIVDEALEVQSVLDFVSRLGLSLIEPVEIFDVYTGNPIPQGKKSVAMRFTYQSFDRSLTDSEVNEIHESVIKKALKEFHAQLPTK